jgi:hypothetical protein
MQQQDLLQHIMLQHGRLWQNTQRCSMLWYDLPQHDPQHLQPCDMPPHSTLQSAATAAATALAIAAVAAWDAAGEPSGVTVSNAGIGNKEAKERKDK